MAKKRRKRHVYSRRKKVREGNLILRNTPNDNAAAKLMGQVYESDKKDVLNATDLNESFKYYSALKKKK
jgi:hypothetical protein